MNLQNRRRLNSEGHVTFRSQDLKPQNLKTYLRLRQVTSHASPLESRGPPKLSAPSARPRGAGGRCADLPRRPRKACERAQEKDPLQLGAKLGKDFGRLQQGSGPFGIVAGPRLSLGS